MDTLPKDHRRENFIRVLCCLGSAGGFVTRQVVNRSGAHPSFSDRPHIRSAWVRSTLLELQKLGLVTTLDDQKPVAWRLTKAGASERANILRAEAAQ